MNLRILLDCSFPQSSIDCNTENILHIEYFDILPGLGSYSFLEKCGNKASTSFNTLGS